MQINSIQAVLCDIGGVLYVGDNAIKGAIQAIEHIKEKYPIRFLTNTTQKTSQEVIQKLQRLGFDIQNYEVITALDITKMILKEQKSDALFLLTDNAKRFFNDLAKYNKKYVVIGDAQENFSYQNLNLAFRELMDGKKLLAIAKNKYFLETDNKLSLDAGGFVNALEFASGVKAQIIGKPSKDFYHLACKSMGIEPNHIVMIGDDINSDILGAKEAGLQTILVKTGKFRPSDLKLNIKPDAILDSIADITQYHAFK